MADEVRHYIVTVPAGTPQATPQITGLPMPPREIRQIDWRVPPGPNGLMGWLLSMGGVPLLPQPAGTYIIANDQIGVFYTNGLPNSGAWQVTAYNTGSYPHSIYLTFHTDVISALPQLTQLADAHVLSSAPDLSHARPVPTRRPR